MKQPDVRIEVPDDMIKDIWDAEKEKETGIVVHNIVLAKAPGQKSYFMRLRSMDDKNNIIRETYCSAVFAMAPNAGVKQLADAVSERLNNG